ncbi:MAG: LysR family transcriptional regulator [Actinomycetota bacterium]|nr:LysR family transcriptional regulator [Actinomycetota bacterium]
MSITLTQLRSFLAIVRTGSVTGAAEELVVTQPSVSVALSSLSRELGVQLTERVGRSVKTTPAGERFAPYAADVIGLLEQGRRAAREAGGAAGRELRLGAVTTAGEHLLPALVRAFSALHPDIALTVHVGRREAVLRRLLDHDADVVIGASPPSDGRLVGVPFLEDELVLTAPAGDPLARRRSVPVDSLRDRVWLLREEGSGTRAMTEQFLAAHELRPKLLTLGSNGAVKEGVLAGLGVSLQSKLVVGAEIDAGLLARIRVRERLPRRRWHVLRSGIGPLRDPIEAFMAFVERPQARAAVRAARRALPAPAGPPAVTR